MIANATAHRRANAFAQALDARAEAGPIDPAATDPALIEGGPAGSAPPDGRPPGRAGQSRGAHAADRHTDADRARMLALAAGLASLPSPRLDAEVRTVQRAQLVAAMEAAFAGGSFDPSRARVPEQRDRRTQGAHRGPAARLGRFKPRSRWGRRLAVGVTAVGVTVGGLGGAAVASTDALPGDTLYGLKRGMEDIRLTMAGDDTDKGEVYLDLASTRLKEARRLMERSKAGPLDPEQIGDVRRALSGVHDEAAEGHRLLSKAYRKDGSLGPIRALATFSDEQSAHWTRLSGRLPTELSPERDRVSSVFDAIESDVTPLRPLLPEPDDEPGAPGGRQEPRPDGGTRSSQDPGSPGPSASSSSGSGPEAEESGPASPEPSGPKDDGLLGDGGLLDPPPPSGSPSPSEEGRTESPTRSVTLPPLLPGLLPGLGLEVGDGT